MLVRNSAKPLNCNIKGGDAYEIYTGRRENYTKFYQVKDLNKHRACDISEDKKVITIVRGNCLTRITANPDGTLNFEFELLFAA